jgi:hypothetical protein
VVLVGLGGFAGCAGVKQNQSMGQGGSGFTGAGGGTPNMPVPTIQGLESLVVSPETMNVPLSGGATGQLTGMAMVTATGTVGGASMDLTGRVKWTSNLPGAFINTNGGVTINAPGTYTITASASNGAQVLTDSATLIATFSGDIFGDGFATGNNNKAVLDSAPSGSANLAYPIDYALFPSNLSPIYAHIASSGGLIARLNFQAGAGTNVNFYANCETLTGVPPGCYVKMPLTLTRLFIAASETADIALTARVFSSGSAPAESQTIHVAWASTALSGGLYYWSVIPGPPKCPAPPNPNPPNYCLLDATSVSGTAIYRYAFDPAGGDPVPQQVWTDDGGPSSNPPYQGAPAAVNNNAVKGHCIGCHSISNDGKYMALTIGGSAAEAANFSLLDIGQQTVVNINDGTSNDPNASPTSNPVEYWKEFRKEGLATENTWGPNGDRLVSMFQSKLYLTTVTVNGLTGTAVRSGPVVPSWQGQEQFASDPFWSLDGSLFVFTSFAQPSVGMYNETGLNGDMKQGGQIVIATADANGIHDDAKVLVGRGAGVTSFYPSISSDNRMVVFNTSTCGSNPDLGRPNTPDTVYGNGSCDGYDDSTSELWIVKPTGGASTKLAKANGTGPNSNSWPRFSPDKGVFRGKDLYWVGFSSRRPYGTQVNTFGPGSAKPQLWIAGVHSTGEFVSDPSYSPVWLPAQNPNPAAPNGNHVPQWVKVAVIID